MPQFRSSFAASTGFVAATPLARVTDAGARSRPADRKASMPVATPHPRPSLSGRRAG